MFKFRKKKLTPQIARVEDLQVGDQLQLKPGTIKPVSEIRVLDISNEPDYSVTMNNPQPDLVALHTVVLPGNMNVIVWK